MPRAIPSGPETAQHFHLMAQSAIGLSLSLETPVENESDSEQSENEAEDRRLLSIDLEIAGIHWESIAEHFHRTGPRGPYNQIPKSVDFFFVCLNAPDRYFRHMFRYV